MSKIGVIGGSGLYDLEGITKKEEISLDTPYGTPSDSYVLAQINGREVVFLPRHGKNHSISPSEINYRANIYGMKALGVDRIISVSACGSLKEELKPLDFVLPDQFVDRTNQARKYTFFDRGVVAHVGFAQPVCAELSKFVYDSACQEKVTIHSGGTYLNMEGPQFSTLAESMLYRRWGMDIIGMTNLAEARLAREAEICFVTLAAITDYDCWRESEEAVTVDVVMGNLRRNVDNSKRILKKVLSEMPKKDNCSCNEALKYSIVTDLNKVDPKDKQRLGVIIDKYKK
ncbi:MAG: S-methyl-5'-thioadenosine phosphorylase [Candidatus Omnitrophica bacterium]|nr:S-methyl-5'-thioadenosine phosphorylase [Candidatus Omnitrophota bacterium]